MTLALHGPSTGSPFDVFDRHESAVRAYCRHFPATFASASGHQLYTTDGEVYVDLLSGAGALNYGHNHPHIKRRVLEYLAADGIVHSLDLHTSAKADFLERFAEVVLEPRALPHRVMFVGPTGANAVEAALKLARKATGRSSVVAFSGGFHGLSLGALAVTASAAKRRPAGVPLVHVTRLPYDGFLGPIDTIHIISGMLEQPGSGVDPPAAFVVEAVQGEGGLQAASAEWLRQLESLAHRIGALLILDEIQTGCGRTGSFLAIDGTGVVPDIVCLSKSLSGLGVPMSAVLVKPELDVLQPGEHSGTFRGSNLGFVGASAALDLWGDAQFVADVQRLDACLDGEVRAIVDESPSGVVGRGRGLMRGLAWADSNVAARVSAAAFRRGVLVETVGPEREVLKFMPPLTMRPGDLAEAMAKIRRSIEEVTE